ncbi:MAG: N-acetyltransferase family protein [Clostridiales bacterium]|nr:N-acetyltransferase family protein [Clostridiales bacterium]
MIIRKAKISDAEEILEIYSPYILNTAVTFEYTVPSVSDFKKRVSHILSEYPYYVCEDMGRLLGYCYGARFMERAAFGWDIELSVYLREEAKGRGIGKALYGTLIDTAVLMNIKQIYALIARPNPESEGLHEGLGFKKEAVLKNTGYKFDRWIDLILYTKSVNTGKPVQPVINANKLNPALVDEILKKYTDMLN